MSLSTRLRKIREYRGMKQSAVASEMNVTQQAYSCLETRAGNVKMDTMQRFCDVMKIEISFLLAFDIPVNDENLLMFDRINFSQVVDEYKKMTNRLSVYEELLLKENSMNKTTLTASTGAM